MGKHVIIIHMDIVKLFSRHKFDQEEYQALLWKKPDHIDVLIQKSDEGYFAKLTNFNDANVVTQASTGRELIEMVNAAMYDYLDIPEVYRANMGYFLPPEDLRQEMQIEIPAKYLNKKLSLAKA
jgi:hypothetical protein